MSKQKSAPALRKSQQAAKVFWVSPETHAQAVEAARLRDQTIAVVVRDAVALYLAQTQAAARVAADANVESAGDGR